MTAADADVYRKAADVLRVKGWCQGTSEDRQGRHCLAGALRVVLGPPWHQIRNTRPQMLLGELLGLNGSAMSTIVMWNDQEGRTADEVIALLEQAAEKVEADQ